MYQNLMKFLMNQNIIYINVRNKNFMIIKNPNLINLQSLFQVKLFLKYNEDIFADGTFFIVPKFSYQVLITRTYINSFYTTSFSIFKNKEQTISEMQLKKKKKYYKV